jgi:hypothetical protein
MAHRRPASVRPRQRPRQQTRTSHLHKKIERMAADLHQSVSGSMPATRPTAICQPSLRSTPPQRQRHPQLTRWQTARLQRWSWRSQSELQLAPHARVRMPLWQRLPFSVLRVPPTQLPEWTRVWAGASCCCGTLGPPPSTFHSLRVVTSVAVVLCGRGIVWLTRSCACTGSMARRSRCFGMFNLTARTNGARSPLPSTTTTIHLNSSRSAAHICVRHQQWHARCGAIIGRWLVVVYASLHRTSTLKQGCVAQRFLVHI